MSIVETAGTASPTSAALLAQLAWRDQSAYELTKSMRRNLHFFWPRAESHIYRQIKHLVDDGYATTHRGATGLRPRTVYRVTDKGRAALRNWLAGPVEGISLENGPLLRVFLGSHATPAELLAAVDATQAYADGIFAVATQVADEYLHGRHEFQEQVHLRAFIFDYLWNSAIFTREWAERARAEISRWDDVRPSPEKHARGIERIRYLTQLPHGSK